jgi:hypothetical protein
MRRRVWLARGGREIAGVKHKIVKAAQGEARPAAFSRKAPEAQDLLLAEREGVLRWYFLEAHGAGSAHPCNGRAKTVADIGELTKSADNKTNNSARPGPIPLPEL